MRAVFRRLLGRKQSAAGAAVAIACFQVAAAATWPRAQLLWHQERTPREAPVSGGYIRGLEVINSGSSSAESPTRLNRLFVPLQPHGSQDLCVQVSMRDGSFLGTYQYRLPSTGKDTYAEIDIGAISGHPEFYRNVSPRDLAVVASASSCATDASALIPVYWNSPPEQAALRTLVVAVQSGDRDATLYWGGKIKSRLGWLCHAIKQPGVARFDSLCEEEITGAVVVKETIVQLEACSFGDCGIVQTMHVEP